MRQLELGARDVVISSNAVLNKNGEIAARQPKIHDTGVAVYFTLHGESRCVPCDRWVQLEDNVHAIELTVEALRGLDRWGASEIVDAAFRGFAASRPATRRRSVARRTTAGGPSSKSARRRQRRRSTQPSTGMVKVYHPDKGGNAHMFKVVTEAYEQAKAR